MALSVPLAESLFCYVLTLLSILQAAEPRGPQEIAG